MLKYIKFLQDYIDKNNNIIFISKVKYRIYSENTDYYILHFNGNEYKIYKDKEFDLFVTGDIVK